MARRGAGLAAIDDGSKARIHDDGRHVLFLMRMSNEQLGRQRLLQDQGRLESL